MRAQTRKLDSKNGTWKNFRPSFEFYFVHVFEKEYLESTTLLDIDL